MKRQVSVYRWGRGYLVRDHARHLLETLGQGDEDRSRVIKFLHKHNLEAAPECVKRFSWLAQSMWDLYKTAKVKDSAPVQGAGEYVAILGHMNETLIEIRFIDGRVGYIHKCHLERPVL